MIPKVHSIMRYPVKGLSGQKMDQVDIPCGGIIQNDRRFGIIHASSLIDPHDIEWGEKKNFLNLARDEKLGRLKAIFDQQGTSLELQRDGKTIASGALYTHNGCMILEDFLTSFMPSGARSHARIIDAQMGKHFADRPESFVSLINLASLKDIERVTKTPLDQQRMRGNLYIEGLTPWTEQSWLGKTIQIGNALFIVRDKISRCNATNVNPTTGMIDVNIPRALRHGFRHDQCGIYLESVETGVVSTGDSLEILSC